MIKTVSKRIDLTPAEVLGTTHKRMAERLLKCILINSILDAGELDGVVVMNFTTNTTKSFLEVVIDYEQNDKT